MQLEKATAIDLSDYIYNRTQGDASAGVFVVAACPVCLFLMERGKVGRKGRSFFINVNYKSAGCIAFGSDTAASHRNTVMFCRSEGFPSVCFEGIKLKFLFWAVLFTGY